MSSWKLQDAKSRFSEFLNSALQRGPQIVTRRGIPTAVLVPIDEWNRLQSRPSLKSILFADTPRVERLSHDRGKLRRRPAVEL